MLDWHCRAEDIQAYVDGELDGVGLQECEAHLRRCSACARLAARLLSLSQSLGAIDPEYPPAELKERILEAVARAEMLPALYRMQETARASPSEPSACDTGVNSLDVLASALGAKLRLGSTDDDTS